MELAKVIDRYVAREMTAMQRERVHVGDSYLHPLLAEENKHVALIEETEKSMRTDLQSFTRQLVNYIIDSLEEAINNPEWRSTAIGEARDGWTVLNRRLARADVPEDLQVICARLALLFQSEGFPDQDDERIEEELRDLIKCIDEICADKVM